MAKEIVQSLREVNGSWEQYYFATVLSAVAVTDADDETRNAKEYIDGLISATADAMRFMGVIGENGVITSSLDETSGKTFSALTGYSVGWSFKVGVAGTYAGNTCEVGDTLICTGTNGTDTDWYVMQANIDGAVTGPATSSDGHLAVFSGESGKVIKDSGVILSSLQSTISNSHTHSNKDILDAITEAFTTELKEQIEELATTVSQSNHSHDNKDVLDSITQTMVDLWNGYDDKITQLETDVETAQSTADEAKTAAATAQSTADGAVTDAETAVTTANEAKTTATTANETANTAKSTAESAESTANTAKTTAESAESTANTATTTANEAKTTAEGAVSTANTANETANTAKSTADGASSAAATAQETAETANEAAEAAQATADSKTKVVWVEKGGSTPTAEANSLCFKVL